MVKATGKKAHVPLVPPLVSDADLAKARKALEDKDHKKKFRSNMSYWLECRGLKSTYESSSMAERKEFLLRWAADRISMGKTTVDTDRIVATESTAGAAFEWMGKETMYTKLGANKAQAKIDSKILQERPDRDTGLMGEWSTEYKVYTDNGAKNEKDTLNISYQNTKEVEGKELEVAKANIEAAAANMAGNSSGVNVKREQSDSGGQPPKPAGSPTDPEGSPADDDATDSKILKGLKTDPRKVLRGCGDTITTLKQMFEQTQTEKYTQAIHDDVAKLLPKFANVYKKVEMIVVSGSKASPDTIDYAAVLAVATKVTSLYESYETLHSWYTKMVAPSKRAKVQKA